MKKTRFCGKIIYVKERHKKGFTLAEMSVAIAVVAIAMSMLALCFVSINRFSQKKERQTEILREIGNFQSTLNLKLQDFSGQSYVLIENQTPSNFFTISSGVENYEIVFDEENKKLKVEKTNQSEGIFSCSYIDNATFQTTGNIIRCSVEYDNKSLVLVFSFKMEGNNG